MSNSNHSNLGFWRSRVTSRVSVEARATARLKLFFGRFESSYVSPRPRTVQAMHTSPPYLPQASESPRLCNRLPSRSFQPSESQLSWCSFVQGIHVIPVFPSSATSWNSCQGHVMSSGLSGLTAHCVTKLRPFCGPWGSHRANSHNDACGGFLFFFFFFWCSG